MDVPDVADLMAPVRAPAFLDRTPPCAGPCPAGENPREFVRLATTGKTADIEIAFRQIIRWNPLVSIVGYVCYHPCQTACFRRRVDETVAIASVERFIGDTALENGWSLGRHIDLGERAPKVLVVGSGPAGLSGAYQLRRSGCEVELHEAQSGLGGMMRYGITRARLPEAILQGEIDRIRAFGVSMYSSSVIRRPGDHFETYDAVLVAGGGGKCLALVDNKVLWNQPAYQEKRKKRNLTEAIGRGRKAAAAIVEYFGLVDVGDGEPTLASTFLSSYADTSSRPRMKDIRPSVFASGNSRVLSRGVVHDSSGIAVSKVNPELSVEDAVFESERCMACGTCFGCNLCVEACPTGAVSTVGGRYSINEKACIGCAECVAVCPSDAMTMDDLLVGALMRA